VLHLVGKKSNRDAIGARVILHCDQGKLLRTLNGGGSYLSSHQPMLVFEIPRAWQPQQLVVEWPSGAQQSLTLDTSAPRALTLLEQP
jgi:enediyne biosynthesis protein E4